MSAERYWLSYRDDDGARVTENYHAYETWDNRAMFLLDCGYSVDQWIA